VDTSITVPEDFSSYEDFVEAAEVGTRTAADDSLISGSVSMTSLIGIGDVGGSAT
jgi:hypothetical protein